MDKPFMHAVFLQLGPGTRAPAYVAYFASCMRHKNNSRFYRTVHATVLLTFEATKYTLLKYAMQYPVSSFDCRYYLRFGLELHSRIISNFLEIR